LYAGEKVVAIQTISGEEKFSKFSVSEDLLLMHALRTGERESSALTVEVCHVLTLAGNLNTNTVF